MSSEHTIHELCRAFEVSRSGYYDWSKRREEPGPRALEDAALCPQITATRSTKGLMAARASSENWPMPAYVTAATESLV
jgi:hypothetical protein